MLIMLSYAVPQEIQDAVLADNVLYRPDLEQMEPHAAGGALAALRPDVLIVRSRLDPTAAGAWRAAAPSAPRLVMATHQGAVADPELGALGIVWHIVAGTDGSVELDALTLAERIWTRTVSCSELPARLARVQARRGCSVTLVGGGIVNLVTALRLAREGYEVALYEAGPDPRDDADWSAYGCTRGGSNARMFTLTEADNYNDERCWAFGGVGSVLERPVSDCGWRICDPRSLSPAERDWVKEHESVPPWLAHAYNEDIFLFNRESLGLWERLIHSEPELFDDVGLCEGILRVYSDADHFREQVARQGRVGATRQVLAPGEVADQYPALGDACEAGMVVGAIEVVGFTLNVHDFVANLVDLLERAGVELRWNRRVSGISWEGQGAAAGLLTSEGVVRSHHYVLSPGAFAHGLLRGTTSHETIHGVLGVWLTVPNLEPRLERSLKFARRGHAAEDSNVTLARDKQGNPTLIFGSGYGWTGLDPSNIDPAELECLYQAVEDTAHRLFPRASALARANGLLTASRRLCVRPWTASSLGVFEIVAGQGGGLLIVTGGHNTGGFAQSPAVAAAVLAALRGESHPMHTLYHPERLRRFYERGADRAAPP